MAPCLFGLFWPFLDQTAEERRKKEERTPLFSTRVVGFAATKNSISTYPVEKILCFDASFYLIYPKLRKLTKRQSRKNFPTDQRHSPARHHAPHIFHLHADEAVLVRAARHRGQARKGLVPAGREDGADRQSAEARGRETRAESDGKAPRRVAATASHSQLHRQRVQTQRGSHSADYFSPSLPGDLVRRLQDIGREDAVSALISGCPLYRIKPSRSSLSHSDAD